MSKPNILSFLMPWRAKGASVKEVKIQIEVQVKDEIKRLQVVHKEQWDALKAHKYQSAKTEDDLRDKWIATGKKIELLNAIDTL